MDQADGERLGYVGGGGPGGIQGFILGLHANGQVGEPAKLTWRLPTETRDIRIPFTSTDPAISHN